MGFSRAMPLLSALLLVSALLGPGLLRAQETDRIWGRVQTVSGQVHEGFIRWDRNEGSWVDQLDGSKERVPFEYQDWWELTHPGDRQRDRVVELSGYRISWDDSEPVFPSSHESGVRFGHIRSLTADGDTARIELRSGGEVKLTGGSTDLGGDLREVLVEDSRGNVVELEWEELGRVEFMRAPAMTQARGRRLHGTVELKDGRSFTGFISWDINEILTTDTLSGEGSDGRDREILFGLISTVRPTSDGAEITLTDGDRFQLSGTDHVDDGNDGTQISDPGLGLVDVDWDEIERVRFHPPARSVGLDAFDGGRRLQGTVLTADSTELTGWIRWDGDEEYSWELLDGQDGGLSFDVEFRQIAAIERKKQVSFGITIGNAGADVDRERSEWAQVTLLDGRILELDGSNDVDDSNNGIFVLVEEGGASPEDDEAVWVMVRWDDFQAVRFDWVEGR